MTEGWCCKCKRKVEIQNGQEGLTKKNTKIVKGTCPNCNTIVCRIGGK